VKPHTIDDHLGDGDLVDYVLVARYLRPEILQGHVRSQYRPRAGRE
jgi:hypothetical protein